jgi:hypothetical protein
VEIRLVSDQPGSFEIDGAGSLELTAEELRICEQFHEVCAIARLDVVAL